MIALYPPLLDIVAAAARAILAHLSLLFVPAGVGVIANFDLLSANGSVIALVLVVSTVLALVASVGTFLAVLRLTCADHAG